MITLKEYIKKHIELNQEGHKNNNSIDESYLIEVMNYNLISDDELNKLIEAQTFNKVVDIQNLVIVKVNQHREIARILYLQSTEYYLQLAKLFYDFKIEYLESIKKEIEELLK